MLRLIAVIGAAIFISEAVVDAQQLKKVFRIGYLAPGNPITESADSEGIRLALQKRGHVEGQNIVVEYRYAEGKPDRFPGLAAELVREKLLRHTHAELPFSTAVLVDPCGILTNFHVVFGP